LADALREKSSTFTVTLKHCERLLKFILELDLFLASKQKLLNKRQPSLNRQGHLIVSDPSKLIAGIIFDDDSLVDGALSLKQQSNKIHLQVERDLAKIKKKITFTND
jgi:hypothetical protein